METTGLFEILSYFNPLFFALGFAFLAATYTIKNKQRHLLRVLIAANSIFLITYLPLVEFLSFYNWTTFPEEYKPPKEFFTTLKYVTQFLLIYIIVIFVHVFNKRVVDTDNASSEWNKIKYWLPAINLIFITIKLREYFKDNLYLRIFITPWMICNILWMYYRVLAMPLAHRGIDSYTVFNYAIFGQKGQIHIAGDVVTPIGFSQLHLSNLTNLIVTTSTFFAGILTLIIIVKMVKRLKQAQ